MTDFIGLYHKFVDRIDEDDFEGIKEEIDENLGEYIKGKDYLSISEILIVEIKRLREFNNWISNMSSEAIKELLEEMEGHLADDNLNY